MRARHRLAAMASTEIRVGSGRAWAAGGAAVAVVVVVAGAAVGLLAAQIAQTDTEGWGALGLAIIAAFLIPIAVLGAILLLVGFVLVLPRWAARLRSRAAELWAAVLVGAVALAVAGLIVAIVYQAMTGNGGNLILFGAVLAGLAAVLGAFAGLIGWLVGGAGRRPAER